jgi:hypothetical protein
MRFVTQTNASSNPMVIGNHFEPQPKLAPALTKADEMFKEQLLINGTNGRGEARTEAMYTRLLHSCQLHFLG